MDCELWRERTLVLKEDSLRKASKTEGPRLPPAYVVSDYQLKVLEKLTPIMITFLIDIVKGEAAEKEFEY